MTRGLALVIVLMGASVGSIGLVAWAGGGDDEILVFKPVAPVESLMHAQDEHFTAIRDLIGNPDADKRFERMAHQAFILAELGNVNQYNRKAKDYQGWARALRDDAKDLAMAASAEDEDAIRDAARRVNSDCKSCHDAYR